MNLCYVFFDNDEDAIKALTFLREDIKTFKGTPIMARIKHKPTNRTTTYKAGAAGAAAANNPGAAAAAGVASPPGATTPVAPAVYRPPPASGLPTAASSATPAGGMGTPVTNQPPPGAGVAVQGLPPGQSVQLSYPVQAPSPAQVIQVDNLILKILNFFIYNFKSLKKNTTIKI